ncbi:hypothetical protein EVAR_16319_1 [Eumeta japonica]|uniref:Secreted protein n=1 Tax=Eumeta variegata TaxID=151549 RepID=A0A4C1VHK2_EUMVA|nr:hypothetical protein EVAR_16319_1 [Eumeta japonica]
MSACVSYIFCTFILRVTKLSAASCARVNRFASTKPSINVAIDLCEAVYLQRAKLKRRWREVTLSISVNTASAPRALPPAAIAELPAQRIRMFPHSFDMLYQHPSAVARPSVPLIKSPFRLAEFRPIEWKRPGSQNLSPIRSCTNRNGRRYLAPVNDYRQRLAALPS